MASIDQAKNQVRVKSERSRRRLLVRGTFASVCILATAAAGWAVIPRGGNLPTAPFSGETWELTVGEEANGDGTFKVCRTFKPAGEDLEMNNSLGGGSCETSPVDIPKDDVITDVVRAFDTKSGIVVLVDLTKDPVSEVVVVTNAGESHKLAPFAMPDSGEQFVAVEVDDTATGISVSVYDGEGNYLEGEVFDLLESK